MLLINHKGFFLNSMPLDIGFHLKRERVVDLVVAEIMAIELEDDLITIRNCRKEF